MYILDSLSTPEIAIDLGTANTRIGTARMPIIESATQLPSAPPGSTRFPLRHGFVVDIARFVSDFFIRLPDVDATEIIESGIVVTGGGAALPRCIDRLAQRLRMCPRTPDDPLLAVIDGARAMLEPARATNLWR